MSAQLRIRCRRWLNQVLDDRSGVTAIEYGLIAASIAVAIVAVVLALSGDIGDMFTYVSESVGEVELD